MFSITLKERTYKSAVQNTRGNKFVKGEYFTVMLNEKY